MTIAAGATDCSTVPSLANRVYVGLLYDNPWSANKSGYVVNVRGCPTTPNGFGYKVQSITTGITGNVEPTWPTTLTNTVVDGGVTWVCDVVANPSAKGQNYQGVLSATDLAAFQVMAYDVAKAIAAALDSEKVALSQVDFGIAGAGGVALQTSTPGTQQTGHFNISGTGSVGKLLVGATSFQAYGGQAPISEIYQASVLNTDADGGTLALYGTSAYGQDKGAALVLGQTYDGTPHYATGARVRSGKENGTSGNYASYLAIDTRANGGNLVERVRVDSAGNVGIGTTAPGNLLHVFKSGGDAKVTIESTGNNQFDQSIEFKDPGGSWFIGQDLTTSALQFGIGRTSNKNDLKIDSNGRVIINAPASTGSFLSVLALPVYANNAAAVTGGLTAGCFYRTGADPDPVCVVH